jgi:hypothetical protein
LLHWSIAFAPGNSASVSIPEPINCLHVRLPADAGTTADAITFALWSQNPAIAIHAKGDALMAVVETLAEGEVEIVAARIRDVIAPRER